MLKSITDLQTQAAGIGLPASSVGTSSAIPTRDLVIEDEDLELGAGGRY